MYTCQQVGLDYFQSPARKFVYDVDLDISPEGLFAVFEDPHAWTVWAGGIEKVIWTSASPFGVGTTRTVHLAGNLSLDEIFIAWEQGRHMAFCLESTSRKVWKIFGEEYHVRDLGNGRCHLTWTVAYTPAGVFALIEPLFAPVMKKVLGGYMDGLQTYVRTVS